MIWLSRLAICCNALGDELLSSRCATAHNRFPRRLPGPDCAVMFRWIWLVVTCRPSRSKLIGPVVRPRIWHEPVPPLTGAEKVPLAVWGATAVLVRLVSVPVYVPAAVSTPFTTEKLVTVPVPVKLSVSPAAVQRLLGTPAAVQVPVTLMGKVTPPVAGLAAEAAGAIVNAVTAAMMKPTDAIAANRLLIDICTPFPHALFGGGGR